MQIALLKVHQIGQEGGEFQFPIGKLTLKLGEPSLLAFQFLVFECAVLF